MALRGSGVGDRNCVSLTSEYSAEKKLDRTDSLVDRCVGQVPLGNPVQKPCLDLRRIESIRAAVVVARKLCNHSHVAILGTPGQATQNHGVDHLLT